MLIPASGQEIFHTPIHKLRATFGTEADRLTLLGGTTHETFWLNVSDPIVHGSISHPLPYVASSPALQSTIAFCSSREFVLHTLQSQHVSAPATRPAQGHFSPICVCHPAGTPVWPSSSKSFFLQVFLTKRIPPTIIYG